MHSDFAGAYGMKTIIITCILIVAGYISVWVVKSHFEAKSFNAVTGKNVSTWQAMWIQLRVQEGSDDKN